MTIDRKAFYDRVRDTLFGGTLTAGQVKGMEGILDAAEAAGFTKGDEPYIAYPLATAYHETGKIMMPVREGFCKSDLCSRNAVAKLFREGKISRNYALPHANGNSYYGRGQVQLTHGENYKKASGWVGEDLYANPDLVLDPIISAKVLIHGMEIGAFRKNRAMNDYFEFGPPDYFNARDIINGDKNRRLGRKRRGQLIGESIASAARRFAGALKFVN